jgi:hypothetical protein|tara:strand:+ start:63 stop:332 length:270 start_codon:yes stop_codon:yes gene_type:complete
MAVSDAERTLVNIRNSLNDINQQVAHKKKTTKWKACKATCDMLYKRVNATLTIHQNGGCGEDVAVVGDSIIYDSIYTDVIAYWKGELLK